MDRIHYEVAVLAHYESQNSGLLGENDPLMNQDVALQSQQSMDAEPTSAHTRPKQDKEPDWFNPMEYLIDEVKECTSGGVTDYISAQEQFQDFDPEDFADFLNPSLGDLDGKDVESNFIGKEKSFMGKLTDKLSNIDQNNKENVKGDLDSNAESDVDSEAYFSAASQPVEEGIPRRANGPLSKSSSESCYSRSSTSSSESCYSRSSSVGYSSRSSSISRSRLTNDQSSDEEVNFGDVDSFSVLSMPFSLRRKKQLRMRKSYQELGTIFSPSFKHGDFVVTKGKESESESFSIDFTNTELTSTFLACPSSSRQSGPSGTGQSGSDSVFATGLTESSSGNATESSLNPLCSPFVPRAMNRSVFNYTTTSHTDSDCPLENFTPLIPTDDSGFGTSNRTADQSQFVNRNLQVEKNSTSEPDSTEVILTDRLVAAEQIKRREFDCKVQHNDDEFFSLKDLSISSIPTDYQNTSSWETITSMSHRVVRIRVTKTSNIVNSQDLSEMNSTQRLNPEVSDKCIHFGSGFAHYVDENFVEIRTHSKVVSTADDVENTVVTFSLTQSNGVSVDIDLKGERGSLHYNQYDRSTVFRCKSKGMLEGYLHLFIDVPILRQTSSFQDSDYFSEESSSCSSNHSTKLESYLNNAEDLQRCEETVMGVIGSLGIIDTTMIEFPGQDDTEAHSATRLGTCENLSLSTAETANTAEVLESNSNPFQYNLSRLNELQHSVPSSESNSKSPSRFPSLSIPVPALEQIAKEEVPSPLRVMEKRKSKISPGVCPYTDQSPDFVAEYKPFSSFASDVILESLPEFPSIPNLSPYADQSDWEMAGLLLAQTHHRAEYQQKYVQKTNTSSGSSGACGERTTAAKSLNNFHDILQNYTPKLQPDFNTESLLDAWDKDLINVDSNLNPLPSYRYFEDLLDYHDQETGQCRCAESGKNSDRAVLISYPHGGQKVVSFGHFSAHRHVGGELYDTPSCAGSCGAPVLAVRQGGVAYVSNIIHAGCCWVNGVSCGIGQAHLDDGKCVSSQLSDLGK